MWKSLHWSLFSLRWTSLSLTVKTGSWTLKSWSFKPKSWLWWLRSLLTSLPRAHPSHQPTRHLDRFSSFRMCPKCYVAQCTDNGEENPQNCPFTLGFHHPVRGGPSHSHRQHAQKNLVKIAHVFQDMLADRHTQMCSLQYVYFVTAPVGGVTGVTSTIKKQWRQKLPS